MLQVGARNMQNFPLLRRLAKVKRPILLKRGPSATVKEWLLAAEYLLSGGNPNVVLCERGIKAFDSELRNTFDLAAIALAKELSHLPVVADPSHGTGRRSVIPAMSRGGHRRRRRWIDYRSASLPGARAFGRTAIARSDGVREVDGGYGQAGAGADSGADRPLATRELFLRLNGASHRMRSWL